MKRKYTTEEVHAHMFLNFYCNPDDLNIIVRKKHGVGAYTMNLGNPWSWVISALLIALICAAVFLLNG